MPRCHVPAGVPHVQPPEISRRQLDESPQHDAHALRLRRLLVPAPTRLPILLASSRRLEPLSRRYRFRRSQLRRPRGLTSPER